jgi:hypothetical protein
MLNNPDARANFTHIQKKRLGKDEFWKEEVLPYWNKDMWTVMRLLEERKYGVR